MNPSLAFMVWTGRCIEQWSYCTPRHLLSVLWYAWSFSQVHCAPKILNAGYSRYNLSLIYCFCELNHMRLRACQCDVEQPAACGTTWINSILEHSCTHLVTLSVHHCKLQEVSSVQLRHAGLNIFWYIKKCTKYLPVMSKRLPEKMFNVLGS